MRLSRAKLLSGDKKWIYGFYYNSYGVPTKNKNATHYLINYHEGDSALSTDIISVNTLSECVGEIWNFSDLKCYVNDLIKIPEHYEGDHLEPEQIGKVTFGSNEFYLIDINGEHICDLFNAFNNYNAEIIGNYIDNPELFK